MWPFLSLTAIRPLEGENLSRINWTGVTISLWRRICFCRSLNHRNDWDPTSRHAKQSSPASCASHQAINHIVVDHQHRGFPQPETRYSSSRGIIVAFIPMFRERMRPLFWELQKHFKKKNTRGWVEFFRRLTLIAGPYPSEPQPDVSSYKSKYDDIDWIVDTLSALQSSLAIFLLEMFWTISWAALSWVCWCRG